MKRVGKRILVVEDEDDWQELIGLWLQTGGYADVKVVSSGAQALKVLQRFTPDAIIMDLQLTDQTGHELSKKIRKKSKIGKVPIVMLTNFADQKVKSLEAGADYFIEKRPNGSVLLATLEALFRRRDMDMGIQRSGDLAFQPEKGEIYLDGSLVATLTPKPYAIFNILVERSPSPVNREELFSFVENREDEIISRALDILINRLRKSLPETLRKRIKSVRSFGYMYVPPAVKKR